jgi:nucleoid-associated protein EbfC
VSKGKSRFGGGGGGPRMPMGGGGGGMGNLANQLKKMQEDMVKAQEALGDEALEVSVGGGAVTIVITGQQRIKSITLKPEVIDPEEGDMLQDMLVAAVNQAIEQSQAMAAERLEGLTGGLNLPGLGF